MKDLTYRQKFALREIAAKLRDASERKNALATKLTEFTSASGHTRKSAKEDPARLKLVRKVQAIEAEISALKLRRHDIQPFDPAAEAKIRATGLVAERDRLLAANERLAGLAGKRHRSGQADCREQSLAGALHLARDDGVKAARPNLRAEAWPVTKLHTVQGRNFCAAANRAKRSPAKLETVAEFLARGGAVTKCEPVKVHVARYVSHIANPIFHDGCTRRGIASPSAGNS